MSGLWILATGGVGHRVASRDGALVAVCGRGRG